MNMLKAETLRLITAAAEHCEIDKAVALHLAHKDIITSDEFQKAYADGVEAYYRKEAV